MSDRAILKLRCIKALIRLFSIYLGNERLLIDFKKDGKPAGFLPDGMTIDTNGFLYVATWGGSKIYKIDPK